MAAADERIAALEMRVDRLETWAGPGQADAVTAGIRAVRGDLAILRRVQNQHTVMLGALQADVAELKTDVAELKTDVAELKTDVAALKTDVADLKLAVQEVLRRLPPPH